MTIESGLGNLVTGAGNAGQAGLAWANARLENIVGSVKTGLGNIWGGGFAGISIERINADVTSSFAGTELETAVQDFIKAIKELLAAYVSTMRKEIAAINSAYEQYTSGAQNGASNVASNASEIRAAANDIRLD